MVFPVFPCLNTTILLLCIATVFGLSGSVSCGAKVFVLYEQGWLIAFYGQQVIALLLDNGLCNLSLTSHSINGEEAPCDIEEC